MDKVTWPRECQTQALSEGWDIFQTDRDLFERHVVNGVPYGYRPFELQADVEAGIFKSDELAWVHVRSMAEAGSALHIRALAFVKQESPAEYEAIMREPR